MKDEELSVAFYDLSGTKFKQSGNTYMEDCLIQDILRKMGTEIKIDSIATGIFEFLAHPLLSELFHIILKPNTPTYISKIKQKFFAWKNHIDLKKPINSMTQEQRRSVLRDFFIINIVSAWNSSDSQTISDLMQTQSKSLMDLRQHGKNQFTMPQTETIPGKN